MYYGLSACLESIWTYRNPGPSNRKTLLPQPTLRRLASPLQYDGVALQAIRHVVPRRCDERVFAAQVFDFLLEFDLMMY
jgi:hypothetical protein